MQLLLEIINQYSGLAWPRLQPPSFRVLFVSRNGNGNAKGMNTRRSRKGRFEELDA